MKISGYRATNILLLVIYCLWLQVQSTAGGKCYGQWAIHACAGGNGKRSDVDDVAPANDLAAAGEGPDEDKGRGGERAAGGRASDDLRGVREGDDLRSEANDREQQLDERQLLAIVSRFVRPRHPRPVPLDPALARLRSLQRETRRRGDEERAEEQQEEEEEEEEEKEEEEPPKLSSTDTNRSYINKDNLTMLRRILDDIASKRDSQRSHDRAPDSVRKEQHHVAEEDFYGSYLE